MADSGDVSIQIDSVSKSFGTRAGPVHALKRVSAALEAGGMYGLIGPEGAGKTTLLRLLVGLLKPTEGRILYTLDGSAATLAEVREGLAYMPQTQSLYPDLSVDEHLEFFRDLYRIPAEIYRRRREELLHITRLETFVARPAGKLSGGMYKKLGLMCALLRSPRVMLLDEPTNGVDPISRREFWDLLYRLRDQRILILVTTAYMDEAERCSHVYLLESGEFIAHGEPRTVLEAENARSFDELFLRRGSAAREARP